MPAKILYIEDNDQNFYLVGFILRARGHEVVWARDGQQGLESAAQIRPDLILLDIQLPIMDGYAVARALREDRELAAAPIVALTSHAMPGDREKALAAGCTGYIEKPIQPSSFALQIEQFLSPTGPEGQST
jgi:two-component system, cell cycle response regulator DivK